MRNRQGHKKRVRPKKGKIFVRYTFNFFQLADIDFRPIFALWVDELKAEVEAVADEIGSELACAAV